MNFYQFCLFGEKTAYDAFAAKDNGLWVYKKEDGSYDFRKDQDGTQVGEIFFNPFRITFKDNAGQIEVHPALLWREENDKKGKDVDKIELFHLARGKSKSKADEIYKKEFYGATVWRASDLVKKINPDLIVYVDSTTNFNRDVLSVTKGVPVQSLGEIRDASLMQKRNYQFMANTINSGQLELFLTSPNSTRGKITALALTRAINNLENGKNYIVNDEEISIQSPLSRERTSKMVAQEWIAAAKLIGNELNQKGVVMAKSDYTIGTDSGKIENQLTSYGHFDAANLRQRQEDKNLSSIVVIDDNINSCSSFNEINRILRTLDATKKAKITWVVGIMKEDEGCFKGSKK